MTFEIVGKTGDQEMKTEKVAMLIKGYFKLVKRSLKHTYLLTRNQKSFDCHKVLKAILSLNKGESQSTEKTRHCKIKSKSTGVHRHGPAINVIPIA